MKHLIVLVMVLLCGATAIAQSYPEDREKFVKALQAATNDYISGDQKDFIKKELATSLLEGSSFSDSYFKQMVATCNLMESKRMKAYPEIYNYVFSVYSFVKNKQPASSYTAWHSSYVFEFTDKPLIRFTDGTLLCGVPNRDKNDKKDARFIDSLLIYNTSGVYDPILKKWDGNGGKIDWKKVGLDPAT